MWTCRNCSSYYIVTVILRHWCHRTACILCPFDPYWHQNSLICAKTQHLDIFLPGSVFCLWLYKPYHHCGHCHVTSRVLVFIRLDVYTPDSLRGFDDIVHARLYFNAEFESRTKVFVNCVLSHTWYSILCTMCCRQTTLHVIRGRTTRL